MMPKNVTRKKIDVYLTILATFALFLAASALLMPEPAMTIHRSGICDERSCKKNFNVAHSSRLADPHLETRQDDAAAEATKADLQEPTVLVDCFVEVLVKKEHLNEFSALMDEDASRSNDGQDEALGDVVHLKLRRAKRVFAVKT